MQDGGFEEAFGGEAFEAGGLAGGEGVVTAEEGGGVVGGEAEGGGEGGSGEALEVGYGVVHGEDGAGQRVCALQAAGVVGDFHGEVAEGVGAVGHAGGGDAVGDQEGG